MSDRSVCRVGGMDLHRRFRLELLELWQVGKSGMDAVAAVGK